MAQRPGRWAGRTRSSSPPIARRHICSRGGMEKAGVAEMGWAAEGPVAEVATGAAAEVVAAADPELDRGSAKKCAFEVDIPPDVPPVAWIIARARTLEALIRVWVQHSAAVSEWLSARQVTAGVGLAFRLSLPRSRTGHGCMPDHKKKHSDKRVCTSSATRLVHHDLPVRETGNRVSTVGRGSEDSPRHEGRETRGTAE
eukprot:scaffold127391_cov32-Tisochrysis_lutea.AAC.1